MSAPTTTRPPAADVPTPRPPVHAPSAPGTPPRRHVGAITLGVLLIAGGLLALLAQAGVDLPLATIGPLALILLGVGVAVGAVRGEHTGPAMSLLITLGVLAALVVSAIAILDVPLRGGVGDRVVTPTSAAELDASYHQLAGQLVVDLRDIELGPGTTVLAVSTALGEATVRLPDGIAVSVDAAVGAGTATVLGTTQDGVSVDNDQATEGYANADRRLALEVRVGLGELTVLGALPVTTSPPADEPTAGEPETSTPPTITYAEEPRANWDVIGVTPGERLDVHGGPGSTEPVVASLAHDAAEFESTGRIATVDGALWREIVVPGDGVGWVPAEHLTQTR